MMKRWMTLLVVCALALTASQALADALVWKSIPLNVRTSTDAGDPFDQGYIDSTTATLGLKATIDTTTAFTLPRAFLTADSLTWMFVSIEGSANFASGESLYVAIEGSATGASWSSVNIATCGTCRAGGFGAAGSIVPGTAASTGFLRFNGKASSTSGIVASASGVIGQSNLYGGHWGWPQLRLKVLSTIATDNVTKTYRIKVHYLAVAE